MSRAVALHAHEFRGLSAVLLLGVCRVCRVYRATTCMLSLVLDVGGETLRGAESMCVSGPAAPGVSSVYATLQFITTRGSLAQRGPFLLLLFFFLRK